MALEPLGVSELEERAYDALLHAGAYRRSLLAITAEAERRAA